MAETTPKKKPFSVPPLELSLDNKSSKRSSKRETKHQSLHSTYKFPNYKPRSTDLERWTIYQENETQFAQSGLPNYSCLFCFLDRESLESTVSTPESSHRSPTNSSSNNHFNDLNGSGKQQLTSNSDLTSPKAPELPQLLSVCFFFFDLS